MSRLVLHQTPIDGLLIIEHCPIHDERGFLERIFCQDTLNPVLKGKSICQINRTITRAKGTVRGLHFQYPPHSENKIITCLRGQVWDLAIDLRRGSPTFLQHYGILLSSSNKLSYLIPEGFAHGLQTLTSNCEMLYLHTATYAVEAEGTLNAMDPRLKIQWPRPITARSKRDKNQTMLTDTFQGVDI
jgi:dTDP-4-dehydrorhamnose 3,5-epimerase